MGFTTPSPQGQSNVIGKAIERAKILPEDITNLEAHGTGTQVGDAIELSALESIFTNRPESSLWLGSVKANIGHLGGAAGIMGLIKMVLALENKVIYPLYAFERFSSECNPYSHIFRVATTLQPWVSDKHRIGGVSSFGLGGTNAHVIIEESTCSQGKMIGVGPYTSCNNADPDILRFTFFAGNTKLMSMICAHPLSLRNHHI
ncbi:hypothetical protein BIY28_23255 [Brenneria goodwinii]|nr:hypothetical protein BIY28_23255 [Brenneria goodwinii]